jgi:hypothetical protein
LHERQKHEEASYFLEQMKACKAPGREFGFLLSAFLSAARSVMQYAHTEAVTKDGGQPWYDREMQDLKLEYFRDKRDFNVHEQPIPLTATLTVSEHFNIRLSETVDVTITREDGSAETRRSAGSPLEVSLPGSPNSACFRYVFQDWFGDGDVIELCDDYLKKLDRLIIEGVKLGFISEG